MTICTNDPVCSQSEQLVEDISMLLLSGPVSYIFGSRVLNTYVYPSMESCKVMDCSIGNFGACRRAEA